ncbi:hypothetical protein [Streptomyces sp. NPDC060205]
MLHRRRKTVVACDTCHDRIHSKGLPKQTRSSHWRAG